MRLVNAETSDFEDAYIADDKAEFEGWYRNGWYKDVYNKLTQNLLREGSNKSILSFKCISSNLNCHYGFIGCD